MRPVNTDREAALACGDAHFEGKACKHCGGTLRYARNYTCVKCSHRHRESRADDTKKPEVPAATLEEARRTKARFYYGKPCFRHPDAPRYRVNGHCKECKKMMDKGEPLFGDNFPTFEGEPCPQGHTKRYVSTSRCVECHRAQCQERREVVGSDPNPYGVQKRKDERDMRRRLALIRAERTAKQKACAYGVPI